MSIWVSYGPVTGEPGLTAADHDYPGRLDIDVAWTNMQEPEVIRLSMSRNSSSQEWSRASAEMTASEVRELVKRLTWALGRT